PLGLAVVGHGHRDFLPPRGEGEGGGAGYGRRGGEQERGQERDERAEHLVISSCAHSGTLIGAADPPNARKPLWSQRNLFGFRNLKTAANLQRPGQCFKQRSWRGRAGASRPRRFAQAASPRKPRAQKKWGPALLPAPTAPSDGSAGVRNLIPKPESLTTRSRSWLTSSGVASRLTAPSCEEPDRSTDQQPGGSSIFQSVWPAKGRSPQRKPSYVLRPFLG